MSLRGMPSSGIEAAVLGIFPSGSVYGSVLIEAVLGYNRSVVKSLKEKFEVSSNPNPNPNYNPNSKPTPTPTIPWPL